MNGSTWKLNIFLSSCCLAGSFGAYGRGQDLESTATEPVSRGLLEIAERLSSFLSKARCHIQQRARRSLVAAGVLHGVGLGLRRSGVTFEGSFCLGNGTVSCLRTFLIKSTWSRCLRASRSVHVDHVGSQQDVSCNLHGLKIGMRASWGSISRTVCRCANTPERTLQILEPQATCKLPQTEDGPDDPGGVVAASANSASTTCGLMLQLSRVCTEPAPFRSQLWQQILTTTVAKA